MLVWHKIGDENTHFHPIKSCHFKSAPTRNRLSTSELFARGVSPAWYATDGQGHAPSGIPPQYVVYRCPCTVSVRVCIRVIRFLVNNSRVIVFTLYIVEWLRPMGIFVTVARKVGSSVFETKAKDNLLSFSGYVVFICRLLLIFNCTTFCFEYVKWFQSLFIS